MTEVDAGYIETLNPTLKYRFKRFLFWYRLQALGYAPITFSGVLKLKQYVSTLAWLAPQNAATWAAVMKLRGLYVEWK